MGKHSRQGGFLHFLEEMGVGGRTLTLEEGADLPPGCDAALAGVLAQSHLQEEHWDAAGEKEDQVGDEECSCGERGGGLSL